MPPCNKSLIGACAVELAEGSTFGDNQRATSCPFATFTEGASDADEAAYGDL
jgi:hypothetical protein